MTTQNQKINCEQAKQIDLVSYLGTLNIHAAKVSGNDYWYYSPFHRERTPSFKINRKLNLWYDHSLGKGGNPIDFGIAYHNCSVAAFLEKLTLNKENNLSALFSFQQQLIHPNEADRKDEVIMKNLDVVLRTDAEIGSNSVVKKKNPDDADMRNSVGIKKNFEDKNNIDFNDSSKTNNEENKRIQTDIHENEQRRTGTNSIEREQAKMKILSITDINNERLLKYIVSREINLSNAQRYCKEVLIAINQKQRCMIGFKNQSGGYELRATDDFKSTIAPKDFTFLPNEKQADLNAIAVVEGFFDFLSLLEKKDFILPELTNFLVLNSLAFFEKATRVMEEHDRVYLLLDNDASGKAFAASALKRSMKYTDLSYKYSEHKDLNHWLVKEKNHERLVQIQRPNKEETHEAEQPYRRGFRR